MYDENSNLSTEEMILNQIELIIYRLNKELKEGAIYRDIYNQIEEKIYVPYFKDKQVICLSDIDDKKYIEYSTLVGMDVFKFRVEDILKSLYQLIKLKDILKPKDLYNDFKTTMQSYF